MSTEEITTQLEAVLALRGLPDSARDRGRALFESLSRPVRIAIVGQRGSGKSTLINLFLGEPLLPDGIDAKVIEIVPGDAFVAEAEYADGSLEAPEADELKDIHGAERLIIAAPCQILKRIVLVEADADAQVDISDIAKDADILLWCSTEFGPDERKEWKAMDSDLQDHSFLILTKADKLARANRLADVVSDLKAIARSEFAGLYPVAALQGVKAQTSKPRDTALWKGSGADVLVDAVLDHARRGRQADLDQAELFLARYAFDLEDQPEPGGGRTRSRIRTRPRSQMVRRRSRMTRPVTRSPSRSPEPAVQADETAAVAVLEKDKAPESATGPDDGATLAERLGGLRRTPSRTIPAHSKLADTALNELRSAGADAAARIDDPRAVIDLCTRTAETLQNLFESESVPPGLLEFAEDVDQTVEMMTLLQLETGAGPAADAVTLLLQIRRGLEQSLAA